MASDRKRDRQKRGQSVNSHPDQNTTEEREKGKSADEDCRCKEVSEKTFPDMFRLMIRDLSFWKKTKKRK